VIVTNGEVFLWSNPDKKRLKAGSLVPMEPSRQLEEKPRQLNIVEDQEDEIFIKARDLTDATIALKNPKSHIIPINQLQLTLKNLPKHMDLNIIFAEDLNIISYFDNIVSKSVDDWKNAMEKNLKYKVYLKAFLQILFKQNKEKLV
jgi:hypothetical protein